MFKKKTTKKTTTKTKETPKVEAPPKVENPYAPGTSRYAEWASKNKGG